MSWLSSVKNDLYQAKCNTCGDIVNITSGIGAVKNHENTPKHLRNFNNNKSQLQFLVKEKGTVSLVLVHSYSYSYYRRTKMESGDFKGVKCSR